MRNKSVLRTFETGDLEGNGFDFPEGLKIFIFPKDVHFSAEDPPSRRILIKKFKSRFHGFPSLPFYWGIPISFCKTVLRNSVLCAATDEQIRHLNIYFSSYCNLQSGLFK